MRHWVTFQLKMHDSSFSRFVTIKACRRHDSHDTQCIDVHGLSKSNRLLLKFKDHNSIWVD